MAVGVAVAVVAAVAAETAVELEVFAVVVAVVVAVVTVECAPSRLLSVAFVVPSVLLVLPGILCATAAVATLATFASSFEGFSFRSAVEVIPVEVAE